jgi:hypothetical protein
VHPSIIAARRCACKAVLAAAAGGAGSHFLSGATLW